MRYHGYVVISVGCQPDKKHFFPFMLSYTEVKVEKTPQRFGYKCPEVIDGHLKYIILKSRFTWQKVHSLLPKHHAILFIFV